MTQNSIRFSVTDGKGNRSSTWKCFAAKSPKNDVYLTCREVGGALKVSLHESGDWRFAYTHPFYEENLDEIDKSGKGRIIERWSKPQEIAPGVILAVRVVVPWGSVRTPIESHIEKNIHWVNKPPDGHAVEFSLLITATGVKIAGWPGKNGTNTRLAGSFQISSGENVWVVYRDVVMPKIEQQSGNFRYFKGKDESALKSNSLRMLALDSFWCETRTSAH